MKLLYWIFCLLLVGGVLVWAANLALALKGIDKQYDEDWRSFKDKQ